MTLEARRPCVREFITARTLSAITTALRGSLLSFSVTSFFFQARQSTAGNRARHGLVSDSATICDLLIRGVK
jgi:hypothetical protein